MGSEAKNGGNSGHVLLSDPRIRIEQFRNPRFRGYTTQSAEDCHCKVLNSPQRLDSGTPGAKVCWIPPIVVCVSAVLFVSSRFLVLLQSDCWIAHYRHGGESGIISGEMITSLFSSSPSQLIRIRMIRIRGIIYQSPRFPESYGWWRVGSPIGGIAWWHVHKPWKPYPHFGLVYRILSQYHIPIYIRYCWFCPIFLDELYWLDIVTSLEWWLAREIMPKWPQVSGVFRWVNDYNSKYIHICTYKHPVDG